MEKEIKIMNDKENMITTKIQGTDFTYKATRMIEYMQEEGKVYEGEILLGFSTTTEDASGQVVEVTPVTVDITEEQVDTAMATFVGEIIQIPPCTQQ